jgi:hypothetical protein
MMDAGVRGNLAEKPTRAQRTRVNQLGHAMLNAHSKVDEAVQQSEEEVKVMKQQRVKSFQLLRGLDHTLLVATGVGLRDYLDPFRRHGGLDVTYSKLFGAPRFDFVGTC